MPYYTEHLNNICHCTEHEVNTHYMLLLCEFFYSWNLKIEQRLFLYSQNIFILIKNYADELS